MNKKSLLWLTPMILLLFVTGRAWSEELPWDMKLPFQEATIHYELSGSEKGKETLYVKEYGKRQAKHRSSVMTIMGMTKKTETLEIVDPDWIYSYDLVEKKGSKTTNPNKLYREEYNKLSAGEKKNFEKNAKEMGSGMMGQFGGSVTQKGGKVLGYDCDVVTVGGMSTVHVLHGSNISLRSETSAMGMNNVQAATKIDTSTAIPDNAFASPAGITAVRDEEAELMMAGMIKNTVDTLMKPDGAKLMQQAGPMGMLGAGDMQQEEMEDAGMNPEEQQEAMRQMREALERMQKK